MANMAGTGAPQSAIRELWRSNITRVEETPEMKARRIEEDARVAKAQAVDKEHRAAWDRRTSSETGMQFGDVSKQTPQQAASNLVAMTRLLDCAPGCSDDPSRCDIALSKGAERSLKP